MVVWAELAVAVLAWAVQLVKWNQNVAVLELTTASLRVQFSCWRQCFLISPRSLAYFSLAVSLLLVVALFFVAFAVEVGDGDSSGQLHRGSYVDKR